MISKKPERPVVLLVDGETDSPFSTVAAGFEIVTAHVRGPEKDVCEDAVGVFRLGDGALLVVVVDGMGGMRNGRGAARLTIESLRGESERFEAGASRRATVVEALERAHALVIEQCPGGGATVVCALVTEDWVQPVHVGDAEALLIGQRGKVKLHTLSHSPVGYAMEAGLLSEEEALHHPERHIVSNGIGLEGMSIHVGPRVPMASRDTLVLASDGVTDNAREAEIVDRLRSGPLRDGTTDLVELCRGRMALANDDESEGDNSTSPQLGKPDDLTVIALRRGSDRPR